MVKKILQNLYITLLALSTFIFFTPSALADVTARDDADVYLNGSSLTGLNAGFGSWTAAWRNDLNSNGTISTTQFEQGGKSIASVNSGTDIFFSRPFTAVASGSYRFWVNSPSTGTMFDIAVGDGASMSNANMRCAVRWDTDGHLKQFHDAFATNDLGAYSTSVWYALDVKWNGTTCQWRLSRTGTGAFSTAANYVNAASATILWAGEHNTNNTASTLTVYIDNLGPILIPQDLQDF